jgi:hypothetical protein
MKTITENLLIANAHLSDAHLPGYGLVVQHLRYLLEQAKKSNLPENNHAIQGAENLLAIIGDKA